MASYSVTSVERTLPWSWYSDAEVLRLEQERIFRGVWQYAGRLDQVAEPGSYFAGRAGDVPVVVTRARDGELRAFLNVCRHRGSVVAAGEGRRESLQCPYHAWTYGLDGTLRSAPRGEEVIEEGLSLLPLSLETWGPFVFVSPDPGAAPLRETLGELHDAVPVEGLTFHHRVEYELEANWKVACENFLECYHCAVAHPRFSAAVDVSPDAYRLEEHRWHSSQYAPGRDGDTRGQFHFVWPNLKINVFPGRPNLSIGPIWPEGPERSRGFLDYFFTADEDERWIAELLELDDQVGHEDKALVENVQKGVRSGVLEEGRLLGESERLIAHFDRLVREALAD
jgi:phenylpropionate dioxygenase-like ring-hydroxylating dioxygenase large terminal subunit